MLGDNELLRISLQTAVPLWIENLKNRPWEELQKIVNEAQKMIAEKGDNILFKSNREGETAEAFNHLARAVAVLSFVPGGITFMDMHFETEYGTDKTDDKDPQGRAMEEASQE